MLVSIIQLYSKSRNVNQFSSIRRDETGYFIGSGEHSGILVTRILVLDKLWTLFNSLRTSDASKRRLSARLNRSSKFELHVTNNACSHKKPFDESETRKV